MKSNFTNWFSWQTSTKLAVMLTMIFSGSVFAQTFSAGAATTINDDNTTPYPNTVNVAGVGVISDISVTLTGLSHTWPSDLDILLVSPTGAM